MIKKTGIIFTLTVVVLLTFSSCFFRLYLSSYKKEFKTYISNHTNSLKTSKVTIKKNQLNAKNSNIKVFDDYNEISQNGVLYDVVSVEYNVDEIIFTVVKDLKETAILTEYSMIFEEDDDKNSNGMFKVLKKILALKYISNSSIKYSNLRKASSTSYFYFEYPSILNKGFLTQETPPPNFS